MTTDTPTPEAGTQTALQNIDWQQVVLNGGPPCFCLEGSRFCLRAKRWAGHGSHHNYVSLSDLISSQPTKPLAEGELLRALEEIRETYIGTEGGISETAYEGYLLQEQKRMYQIAVDAIAAWNNRRAP